MKLNNISFFNATNPCSDAKYNQSALKLQANECANRQALELVNIIRLHDFAICLFQMHSRIHCIFCYFIF